MAQAPTTTTKSSTSSTSSADLAQQLASAQSSIIYVDLDLNDADAAAMLTGDPPLHVEHDDVRGLWAVRKATDDEVAQAKAAASTTSTSASSSTPASSSTTTA